MDKTLFLTIILVLTSFTSPCLYSLKLLIDEGETYTDTDLLATLFNYCRIDL